MRKEGDTAMDIREKMAEIILERTGMTGGEVFHTIHNYIDTDEMILRKGAIAAHSGEKVLIPINMRDGSVLAIGKGNPEWNYSAPHGAGRIMSRTKAFQELTLEEYQKTMEGIYTTSVNEHTLDEAPMAYKSLEDIIDVIKESVDIIDVMKPIYNFKASDQVCRNRTGLSERDLQDVFGFTTPQAIYKWQHGTAMPTIDNLVVLAAIFDVAMDDIVVIDADVKAQISA